MLVVPDVLANAGGVVVSYFEWVQGLQELFWTESEVNARLQGIVGGAFAETWALHDAAGAARSEWPPTGSPCSGSPRRATIRGLYP